MIPLIQFDGKTNTPGEWEAGKKGVGVSAGGVEGRDMGTRSGRRTSGRSWRREEGGVQREWRRAEASSSRLKS